MHTKLAIELEVEIGSGLAFISTQLNHSLAAILLCIATSAQN
jgi:hypothetical protein